MTTSTTRASALPTAAKATAYTGTGTPSTLVFCDVDETLIRCKSLIDFLGYYLAEQYGDAGSRRAARLRDLLAAMATARVPRERASRCYFRAWAGESAAEVDEAGGRWCAERSAEPGFYVTATRAELRRHAAEGAGIVLISGSFPALVRPIAADVDAADIACTRVRARDGVLTGEVVGSPMIGRAKRIAVRDILRRHPSVSAEDCFAYGDHESDLPMLSEVGKPVVVGADPELLRRLPRARVLPPPGV